MTELNRPVDRAMNDERPEKNVVRRLWIDEVRSVASQSPDSKEPWYLTLSGAEGRDIEMIIDQGLIQRTEVNGIATEDQNKIVAVERSNIAVLNLQKKFYGLKIKQVNFPDLIRGDGPMSWPQQDDYAVCRARVVNLDFNEGLRAEVRGDRITFPVLEWIKKLCVIHAIAPHRDWTLCLTLNGTIHSWEPVVSKFVRDIFDANLQMELPFATNCSSFLGSDLLNFLIQEEGPDYGQLQHRDHQKFLMIIVPKIIAKLVHNEGWRLRTVKNLCYGGGERAPMVTWIFKFAWDGRAVARPYAIYQEALIGIFSNLGQIGADGEIVPLYDN